MDYRARAGAGAEAGAGAAILTSWSRSRAKMERLHNTAMPEPTQKWFLRTLGFWVGDLGSKLKPHRQVARHEKPKKLQITMYLSATDLIYIQHFL